MIKKLTLPPDSKIEQNTDFYSKIVTTVRQYQPEKVAFYDLMVHPGARFLGTNTPINFGHAGEILAIT